MTRTIMLAACLFTANLAAGCDSPDDAEVEYRDQLSDAEVTLEDAIDPVLHDTDAVIVDATFEQGVDDGFYLVEAIVDEELTVFEIDAMTGERVVSERTRARPERIELARRHHHARRRLAQLIREIRAERSDERAVRARLVRDERRGDEVEVELMDRRGRRHAVRRRLDETRDRDGR